MLSSFSVAHGSATRPKMTATEAVSRKLAERLIAEARSKDYRAIRLDTIGRSMASAIALYRALGFREISPYAFNPVPSALFMELDLA